MFEATLNNQYIGGKKNLRHLHVDSSSVRD
jgi:hypothetical protein